MNTFHNYFVLFCIFLVVAAAVEVAAYQNVTSTATYKIPCTKEGLPANCEQRVRNVVCNSVNPNGYPTVTIDEEFNCESYKLNHRQWINVQFYQITGTTTCQEVTMQVGECWGKQPKTGSGYDCQGECGAGCINGCGIFSLGGGWSRNCLRHDVCSWYYGASGGGNDAYCGKSYKQADHDIFNCNCEIKDAHTCNF